MLIDVIHLIVRCVLFYGILILALRLMGKREIGELSVLDIVITFVMSELLAMSISSVDHSIFLPVVAIAVLVLLQYSVSLVCIKSKRIRDFFEGCPVVIVSSGVVDQKAMLKHRYTIDDLLSQLRSEGCSTIDEVQFALLENSGMLTVLKKKDCMLRYPFPLISDGEIQKQHLKAIDKSEKWLIEECRKNSRKIEDVFLAMWTLNGLSIVDKQLKTGNQMKKCCKK